MFEELRKLFGVLEKIKALHAGATTPGERNAAASARDLEMAFRAVFFRPSQVDTLGGNLEHGNSRRPAGVVNVNVKILFHHFERLAGKTAEMVFVLKSPRSDLRPARKPVKLPLLRWRQQTVEGFEPAILIGAHVSSKKSDLAILRNRRSIGKMDAQNP